MTKKCTNDSQMQETNGLIPLNNTTVHHPVWPTAQYGLLPFSEATFVLSSPYLFLYSKWLPPKWFTHTNFDKNLALPSTYPANHNPLRLHYPNTVCHEKIRDFLIMKFLEQKHNFWLSKRRCSGNASTNHRLLSVKLLIHTSWWFIHPQHLSCAKKTWWNKITCQPAQL